MSPDLKNAAERVWKRFRRRGATDLVHGGGEEIQPREAEKVVGPSAAADPVEVRGRTKGTLRAESSGGSATSGPVAGWSTGTICGSAKPPPPGHPPSVPCPASSRPYRRYSRRSACLALNL